MTIEENFTFILAYGFYNEGDKIICMTVDEWATLGVAHGIMYLFDALEFVLNL